LPTDEMTAGPELTMPSSQRMFTGAIGKAPSNGNTNTEATIVDGDKGVIVASDKINIQESQDNS